MECFDSGEDVVRALEPASHGVAHGHGFECVVESVGVGGDEVLYGGFCEYFDAQCGSFFFVERSHHVVEEFCEFFCVFL